MSSVIRLATRTSQLALCQARWVAQQLSALGVESELVPMTTIGDRTLGSLDKSGGKGLFIHELEQALLKARVDVAVHSAKDMPGQFPPGLEVPIICAREDRRDAWIGAVPLAEMPAGSKVGTSSSRRAFQILALRPDLQVEPVRGNVDTRLQKLDSGAMDALVLASAGLHRLQLADRIGHYFSLDEMVPACAQGALGIEIRSDDSQVYEILKPLTDSKTQLEVEAERTFVARLGANCHSALGVSVEYSEGVLLWRVRVGGGPRGIFEWQGQKQAGDVAEAREAGEQIARELLAESITDYF